MVSRIITYQRYEFITFQKIKERVYNWDMKTKKEPKQDWYGILLTN